MKILLVSESASINSRLENFCMKRSFYLIVYSLPLKALDNLTEISPDILIINTVDFPRHWKILLQFVNSEFKNLNIKKVLIIEENFSSSDYKKSQFLETDLLLDINKDFELDKLLNLKKHQ